MDGIESRRRAAYVAEALSKCSEMIGLVVSLVTSADKTVPLSGAEWEAAGVRHRFAQIEMAKAAVFFEAIS